MSGRYSKGTPNIGVFLRGHAGDALRVDRINRPAEYVEKPTLTLGLAVQPEVLRGLIHKPGFRGRGLLGRFLYALPKPNIGRRKINPSPMSLHTKRTYHQNILNLLSLPFGTDKEGHSVPHILTLSPSAEDILNKFEATVEQQLGEQGELNNMQDWGGKLVGAVVRIAGILHMVEHVSSAAPWASPISKEHMETAIGFSHYLISHAKAAYDEMGANPNIEAAKIILDWIIKKGCDRFSKRDLFNEVRRQVRFQQVKDLEPALNLLCEHGYIKEVFRQQSGPGRKPSPLYEVNPYSHNPQNKKSHGQDVYSAYSADIAEVRDKLQCFTQGGDFSLEDF